MSEFYHAIPLRENVYRITSVENVFCELLVGEEKAMLIDTGYGFGDLKGFVREITDKPLIIANTHGHVDHTSGNCQFEEQVYLSEADTGLCKRHNTPEMRRQSARLAEHTMDWATGKERYGLPEDFDRAVYERGGTGNLVTLTEGMIFDLGGITIEAVATPGHTKGGMSFHYKEENWLYVGDAANMFLWLFDGDATDRATHIATMDKILALHPQKVFGGHASQPMIMEDIKRFRRVAEEADFAKGVPFETPLAPDSTDIRICTLDGFTMEDMGKPGFAAIVIDKNR